MQTPAVVAIKTMRTWDLIRGLICVAAVLAACLCPVRAFGQTNSMWNGGTGNWSTSTDWTPNQVPNNGGGNTYNVTIDSTGPANIVDLDINVTINSLVLGGATGFTFLESGSDALNIIGSLTVNKTGSLSSDSLTVGGNLTNANSIHFEGGTQTVAGTFTNNAGAVFVVASNGMPNEMANVGTLVNNGLVEVDAGTLNLTNQPNGVTDVGVGTSIVLFGTLTAGSNNGLFNLGSIEGALTLANGQRIVVTPGSGTLKNTGVFNLEDGTSVVVNGNLTNSGQVRPLGNSEILTVTGTFTNQAGGIVNFSYLPASNSSLTLNSSGFNNAGTLSVDSFDTALTLQISNGATNTGTLQATTAAGTLVLNGGIYANTGGIIQATAKASSVQINGATISRGTLNVAAVNSTIDLNSAMINGAALIGKGTFVSSGSTVMTGGSNASTLQVTNGSSLTLAGLITNTGKIELAASGGTTQLLISGNVALGGTISMSNNANNVIEGASTGNEVLTNEGTIEGSGNIGNGFMGLVNTRTIVANQSTPLTIDASSAGFSNSSGTKNGTLQANQNDTLNIVGPFSNFSGTTLTGGTYSVAGTLEFTGADIVTNAASITLTGSGSKILNSSNSADALASSFAVNTSKGSFTLAGGRNFTTPGNFSNAGKMTISSGSTFTVGGTNSYKQTAGTTIVSGTLAVTSPGGVDVSGGSVFGTGTITGNIDLTGGLLSPGAASKKAGELTVKGTYAQSGAGAFDVDLGGTTAGTQYDVLNITSTAMLGGVLNVDLISGFTPAAGDTFTIMDYSSEMGTFSTTHLPTVTGDHWTITYNAMDVVLTLVAGPVPAAGASPSAKGPVNNASATRVSRNTGTPRVSAHEPVAILSRVSCFGARLVRPAACGGASVATVGNGGEMNAAVFAGSGSVAIHNNVMVATRSLSAGRGLSHETSASATAMARLYVALLTSSSRQ